ncbi:hypothetical protein OIU76_023976 [Salix suchowensis]|nr:hypothetical protein OIU76_023976 [Salix suchowensis]
MADVPVEESMRLLRLVDTDSTADDQSKISDGLSKGYEGVITLEGLMADLLEDLEAASKQREIEDDIELILTEILKVDVCSFPSNDSRI